MSDKRKASSVEWFAKKVKDHCDRTGEAPSYHQIGEWQKEAKARHRKEVEEAWDHGFSFTSVYQSAKEYYNKTFNNGEQSK